MARRCQANWPDALPRWSVFLAGAAQKRPSRNIATPPVPVWRKCIWPPMISARPAPTRIQSGIGRNYSPWCRARANAVAPELAETIEGELARITDQWPHDLPRGIIHADYFPDNVFFDKTSLSGIIDFYFACEDALAYDVAIALNALVFLKPISVLTSPRRAPFWMAIRAFDACKRTSWPPCLFCAAARPCGFC